MSTKQSRLGYLAAKTRYWQTQAKQDGLAAEFPDEATWTAQQDTTSAAQRIASTAGRPLVERADAAEREIARAIRHLHQEENARRAEDGQDAISYEQFKQDQAETIAAGDDHLIAEDVERVAPGALAAVEQAKADYNASLGRAADAVAEQLTPVLSRFPASSRFASTVQDAMQRAALQGTDAATAALDALATANPGAFVDYADEATLEATMARLAEAELAPKENPYDAMSEEQLDAAIRAAAPNPGGNLIDTNSDALMFVIGQGGVNEETARDGFASLVSDVANMTADTPAAPEPDFSSFFGKE